MAPHRLKSYELCELMQRFLMPYKKKEEKKREGRKKGRREEGREGGRKDERKKESKRKAGLWVWGSNNTIDHPFGHSPCTFGN